MIRKLINKVIPSFVKRYFFYDVYNRLALLEQQTACYSQEGEDLILDTFFHDRSNGFYVDVGAYHPVRFSNTYLFYRKGWRGINIDARPGSMELFRRQRPGDINLEIGVGTREQELTYYMFDEPGLNSFSQEVVDERVRNSPYRLIGTTTVNVTRLDNILDRSLPPGKSITFLSIDVEGLDLDVLRSNNWDKYKPEMILAETSILENQNSTDAVGAFLIAQGYTLVAKTYRTSFFKLNR